MEQNADDTYRIVLSVVSADLQNAASYIITATAAAPARQGDVNGDGLVDVADVALLINVILGTRSGDGLATDVNGDSLVDVSDVAMLINIVLGNH